jgi:putative photosynthetic complex assembly protein
MQGSDDFATRNTALAIGVLLCGLVLSVATVRHGRVAEPKPAATSVAAERLLRFEDRPDGSVAVIDAARGIELERVQGEAGFLRGTLRALVRERQRRGLGPEQPFRLVAAQDGRLSLADPATGERIALDSFGPTNAAVFGRLLNL